ncbi:hypothetical protein P3T76_002192 [Phytophthora citrophthora]|uniref:Uncharacterized protein n=1 Tax=Phytophthora citrophthora TaxID=4793 RepID=A0AAD9LR28_9STRA|nr:hypothetical protein P3T76_002192 [Phytophthora citrophthora]
MAFSLDVAIVTLLWLVRLSVGDAKMYLYFNNRFMGFGFSHTQRCYTISHCWDDHSKDSEWKNLPKQGGIVWYEDKYCNGVWTAKDGPKGSINFKGTKLYNKVSSSMVREYGLYPTDGVVDHCHENSVYNPSNASRIYIDLDSSEIASNGSTA